MNWKWQWFSGGHVMFWLTSIFLVLFVFIYVITYIVDPTTVMYMKIQSVDETSIKEISEEYLESLNIKINKPIVYRFVQFQHEEWLKEDLKGKEDLIPEAVLLGTFHEWNNTYYIDISVNLYKLGMLHDVVRHEIRHMIVQELKNENIIDLSEYTEDIAQEKNEVYNNLFNSSIKLLQEHEVDTINVDKK